MYYDLNDDKYITCNDSKALGFLYNTLFGRMILKLLTTKVVANIYSKYMCSKLSIHKIKKFVKKNNINMDEYEVCNYKSFNDFFIRKIKKNKRKIDKGLIAVCDSKLTVYKINKNSSFKIKNSVYTVSELIGDKKDYDYALVFRLCVDDYHHYIFPDDGRVLSNKYINGILHTVQPIAFKKYKVFTENSREVTYLDCKNLGDVCFVEVGAMFVGKIVNESVSTFLKGDEKGHFEFGGSTVVMLIKNNIKINQKILNNSKKNIETIVKMGQKIGDLCD